MYPKHTCIQVNVGEEEASARLWYQMCEQEQGDGGSSRCSHADNYKIKKNPWAGVASNDLFTSELGDFWLRCTE